MYARMIQGPCTVPRSRASMLKIFQTLFVKISFKNILWVRLLPKADLCKWNLRLCNWRLFLTKLKSMLFKTFQVQHMTCFQFSSETRDVSTPSPSQPAMMKTSPWTAWTRGPLVTDFCLSCKKFVWDRQTLAKVFWSALDLNRKEEWDQT